MSGEVVWNDSLVARVTELLDDVMKGEEVWLISAYTRLHQKDGGTTHLNRAIERALGRGASVQLVIRDKDGEPSQVPEDLQPLADLGVQISEVPHLHAKLYLSPKQAIISSLNLYAPTRGSTIDLGIAFRDADSLGRARQFIESQVKPTMRPLRGPGLVQRAAAVVKAIGNVGRGYCIRCGERIELDPNYPLCEGCFEKWARHGNPGYPEKRCHDCGEPREVTRARPLCTSCFRRDWR